MGKALAELGRPRAGCRTSTTTTTSAASLRPRYRSIRSRLEREVERLHAGVDGASKRRVVLHPDPKQLWAEADSASGVSWCA